MPAARVTHRFRIDVAMKQIPDRRAPRSPHPQPMRVIHISMEPRTWWGKLLAGVIGILILAAAFFLSIVLFTVVLSIAMVAFVYFIWMNRAGRNRIVEEEKAGRDRQ
jgi:hypothetical protein